MENNQRIDLNFALNEIQNVSKRETDIGSTFVEMLKDEINSTEETEVYSSVKKLINKYKDDDKALRIIDEVIEAISGGATMTEVLLVARDEVMEPTPVNAMDFDNMSRHGIHQDLESENDMKH